LSSVDTSGTPEALDIARFTDDNTIEGLSYAEFISALGLAPIESPTFTGTVTIPTPFTLGAVSVTATGTEINYLVGLSELLTTSLNGKSSTTHASQHAPNGADPVDTWYWGGALTVGDATPPVTNGYLYDCTGGTTIAILDFYDSGDDDHSEFTDGDRIGVLMNDTDVTLDFDGSPAATYLEGNAGTDFTGHATQIQLVIFIYRNGVWYTPSLTMGQSNALTLLAKVGMNTNTFTGNDTMDAAEAYNYTHYVTSAAEIELPVVAQYMSFTVITVGAIAVSIDPDASDDIVLDGVTTLGNGDKATNLSVTGDMITCTYYVANSWYCASNGWTDGGP